MPRFHTPLVLFPLRGARLAPRSLAGPWRYRCLAALLAFAPCWNTPAGAEVVAKDSHGFMVRHQAVIDQTPQVAYRALLRIEKWWAASHTYSGDANNLYLEAHPKGWFGERLPDQGFVRHLEVVYLEPGKELRMTGGLGPLQGMGVFGALTITLEADQGKTKINLSYHATGFVPGGMEPIAPLVNNVLEEQVHNLVQYANEK